MQDGEDEVPPPLPPPPARRRTRRRTGARAKTISIKRMSKESRDEQQLGRALYPPTADAITERPKTRGDCYQMDRPCPFVSCKWHLYLDVNPLTGSIKHNFPDKEVWELKETCALDVADRNGSTLDDVGVLTNLTRERVRQVEVRATQKLSAGILAREPDLADDLRESLHADWPEVPSPPPDEAAQQTARILLLAHMTVPSPPKDEMSDGQVKGDAVDAPVIPADLCAACGEAGHDAQACLRGRDDDAP